MNPDRLSSRRQFEAYEQVLRLPLAEQASKLSRRTNLRDRSAQTLVREFFRLARKQRRTVFLALLIFGITALLALVPPAATKFLIDNVLEGSPLPQSLLDFGLPSDRWQLLLLGTAVILGVSWIKAVCFLFGQSLAMQTNKRLQLSIRKRLFEHVLRLPLCQVYQLKSGGISSLLRTDVSAVGELVSAMLCRPWQVFVQLVGTLIILASVDLRLLGGALAALPLVFFTHRTWIGRIRPRRRDIRKLRREIDALTTEIFSGMRVVRGFSRQRTETARYMRANHLMCRQDVKAWWRARVVSLLWGLLIPTLSAGLLLFGGRQVLNGHLTLGDLTMFLVYMLMLLGPLSVLAESAASLQNGLAALDRVLDVLSERREMLAGPDSQRVDRTTTTGRITFENVSFCYPGSELPALSEINLDVAPGEMIALVGSSGAGKTTFCNLVARFYDPTGGRICFDGVDLRDLEVESYRNLLGIVEQDVFLFDGTVAENIGYADRHADFSAIQQAAQAAHAEEFIRELPNGYDTLIGERGVKLSGGQRQRLAIARALLADPKLLIFDEATSNLDTKSERLIQSSLQTLTAQRTTFVIAHRLSTIVRADRIVVLENGRIREIGDHESLMRTQGDYCEMIQGQIDVNRDLAVRSELADQTNQIVTIGAQE